MSGPFAEGGPLPPVDREVIAEHERQLAEWQREIDEKERGEEEKLRRIRDGIAEL